MKSRKQLLALFCLTLSCGALPSLAQADVNVVIGVAPPLVYHHSVSPLPRHGYVWAPGHWQGGSHAWVGGRWIHDRPGHHWRPQRWHQHGARYHSESSRWQRDHHYSTPRGHWNGHDRHSHRRGHGHHGKRHD